MSQAKDNVSASGAMSETLRLLRACPLCHAEYLGENVAVIVERSGAELVHCACAGCGNAMLALVVRSPLGVSSVAAMTDLSKSDAMRLRASHPLTDDDVLSFHRFLTEQHHLLPRLFVPRAV